MHPVKMFAILEGKGEDKMKKGSLVLRFFLYASLVSLVWLGGYLALSRLFSVEEPKKEGTGGIISPAVRLPEPKALQWSVLAVKDEEGDVTDFWIRYGDFRSDVLVFMEVPTDTKVELAAGGYEVLKVHNPELPKLFMVSDLCRIFSEETMCMAAEEISTALLGVRPTETYIIEDDVIFEAKYTFDTYTFNLVYKDVYETLVKTENNRSYFRRDGSVDETIAIVAANAVTNDTEEEELAYWESYSDVDYIYYLSLPGRDGAQEFVPDKEKIAETIGYLETGEYERLEIIHQD